MSRGHILGISYLFAGLFVSAVFQAFISSPAVAADTSHFYCRRIQGNPYTDFALAVTGKNISLQPYSSPESPGNRIYRGKMIRVTPSGNILVDFNTYSKIHFLTSFPQVLVTPAIFQKGALGYVRVYNGGSNPARDTVLSCEVKKIFY